MLAEELAPLAERRLQASLRSTISLRSMQGARASADRHGNQAAILPTRGADIDHMSTCCSGGWTLVGLEAHRCCSQAQLEGQLDAQNARSTEHKGNAPYRLA
jgi:hypothetical protein